MFRHARFQTRTLIEFCKSSESIYKNISIKRCYRKQGIFDDEDDYSYDDNKKNFREHQPRTFNRYSDKNSNVNNFRFNDRNSFKNANNRFINNQSRFARPIFGQELVDASFEEEDLTPIEKFLYVESSDVAERSEEEIETYRRNFNIAVEGTNISKPIMDFHQLCLPDSLQKVIQNQNYSKPTPIQSQGWPVALSGRDMVGISQTGSGKTLVFMIPAIIHALNQHQLKPKRHELAPQVLVLAPTRELVQQIAQVSTEFCDAAELICSCAYGGASKNVQLRCLQGAHICIATPGRLIDFISEGRIDMKKCTYLVLDEADRMLDMGFEPQIRKIIGQIRPDRQTLMWSATWPVEIQNLAEDFLTDYVKVTVGDGELVANPNIEQNIYVVDELEKEERLISLLKSLSSGNKNKVLVFAQTKRTVDYLGSTLNQCGIKSLVIHGDISQTKRDHVLDYFRKKSCILIATDVAARGLDISDVQHVVNYDFPTNIEDYIHRIGRTARGTSSGAAHSFFTLENSGVASDLVAVLKQAKQKVNSDLLSLSQKKYRPRSRSVPMRSMPRQRYHSAY